MIKTTTISWTDQTWNMIHAVNLVTGKRGWHCEHVTEACRNCYAETLNMRAGDSGGTGLPYKPGHRKDIDIFLNDAALIKPLHWRAPRKIFVCSMTDLFADFVPDEWLDRVFAIMALCPQHQFQVLTKRPARMRCYLSADTAELEARIFAAANDISPDKAPDCAGGMPPFPLPNAWLGTSLCDQPDADKFVPDLLGTPAAIRFLSCEPLLGPIHLGYLGWPGGPTRPRDGHNALIGARYEGGRMVERLPKIDWVIAGGESGKEARPMHPDWARALRDQCAAVGVPFHFKQQGEFLHETQTTGASIPWGRNVTMRSWPDDTASARVGVRAAGRLLDGLEHNAFPAVA